MFRRLTTPVPTRYNIYKNTFRIVPSINLRSLRHKLRPLISLVRRLVALLKPYLQPCVKILSNFATVQFDETHNRRPQINISPQVSRLLRISNENSTRRTRHLINMTSSRPTRLTCRNRFRRYRPHNYTMNRNIIPPIN